MFDKIQKRAEAYRYASAINQNVPDELDERRVANECRCRSEFHFLIRLDEQIVREEELNWQY